MDPTGQNNQEVASTPKQQAVERIRQAVNVLVTVRNNPSVDELAACIGFTLMLNKLGKHATAVFSGQVPSTLEFLKPEDTLESNTDSLRDFIISLDKSKADKLRYKVEENIVRIFITPYRTSITEKDLDFTQGDFNVDAVVALGVTQREELDQAITSHGRILHDAAVIAMTAGQRESKLGTINWQEPGASSLSEMLVSISEAFQGGLIDSQMATAFLTGIVAETARFSNTKTTPKVMTMAAQLMAAGANQQLIANELEKGNMLPPSEPAPSQPDGGTLPPDNDNQEDGALSISHEESQEDKPEQSSPAENSAPDSKAPEPESRPESHNEPFIQPPPTDDGYNPLMPAAELPKPEGPPLEPVKEEQAPPKPESPPAEPILPPPPGLEAPESDGQIHIDPEGNLMRQPAQAPKHKIIQPAKQESQDQPNQDAGNSFLPPSSPQQTAEQNYDPLTAASAQGGVNNPVQDSQPKAEPASGQTEDQANNQQNETKDDATLLDIEKSVHSPHLEVAPPADSEVDSARSAVMSAINQAGYDPERPEPRVDLGAQYGPQIQKPTPESHNTYESFRLPPNPPSDAVPPPQQQPQDNNDYSPPPPPVPPPMMPQ